MEGGTTERQQITSKRGRGARGTGNEPKDQKISRTRLRPVVEMKFQMDFDARLAQRR